jgi:hypothetical protein
MLTLLDRPHSTTFRALDVMVAELSGHLTDIEIDMLVDSMHKLATSKHDVYLSVEDAKNWIVDTIGRERYTRAVTSWTGNNQKILTAFGKLQYKCVKTNELYDGLDAGDNPADYEKVYV